MPSRRTAAAVARTADDEPPSCFCGAAEYDYSFVRFPMTHVSRCRKCGLEHRCVLKLAPARSHAPRAPNTPPVDYPPFWY